MNKLENYIFNEAKGVIQKIDPNELIDIYSYSFYISNIDDDARLPSLTIGYNTETNLNENIESASSKNEAKWNYAFWIQNELVLIGEDDDSKGIISEWIENQDLHYTDEDEDDDFDTCLEKGENISKSFVDTLIVIVQRLPKEQITELPNLIHDLEYYDEIKNQNILANGIERVREFADWIDSEIE
ncbi:MAG: hypothetical protein IPH93_16410 [Saprospiraceae bacterium]|nr:hypothetical protein [Saprospiraceae bacterium]MBK7809807.1 hypothetical protein [Saprospiraceae bacterium]MBK9632081.1 hypothetical protein [Saprospiraceae bacterium]